MAIWIIHPQQSTSSGRRNLLQVPPLQLGVSPLGNNRQSRGAHSGVEVLGPFLNSLGQPKLSHTRSQLLKGQLRGRRSRRRGGVLLFKDHKVADSRQEGTVRMALYSSSSSGSSRPRVLGFFLRAKAAAAEKGPVPGPTGFGLLGPKPLLASRCCRSLPQRYILKGARAVSPQPWSGQAQQARRSRRLPDTERQEGSTSSQDHPSALELPQVHWLLTRCDRAQSMQQVQGVDRKQSGHQGGGESVRARTLP